MGKSTFSMAMASIAFCMFTRSGKVPSADISCTKPLEPPARFRCQVWDPGAMAMEDQC
jgi:hypothetical protein